MATSPNFAALQRRVDRNRDAEAPGTARATGDGTGVDIRASLPPIYREQGHQQGGDGRRGGKHTQLARAIQGTHTSLFPTVGGRPVATRLFNNVSPASYFDASVPAARLVPGSATENYRNRFVEKYIRAAPGVMSFNTPAFTAKDPSRQLDPTYDIPDTWTKQMSDGMTMARLNDPNDHRPMPHRVHVYNLVGTCLRP